MGTTFSITPNIQRDVYEYFKIPSSVKVHLLDQYEQVNVIDEFLLPEETKTFIKEQNKLTENYCALSTGSNSDRFALKAKLTQLINSEKCGCPSRKGSRYSIYRNTGLQNHYVLYVQKSLDEDRKAAEIFFDPNCLSEDGTTALGATAFSEDGKYFAYSLIKNGNEWETIHIRDVDTKEDLSDQIKYVKYSNICWTHDNKGFFYCRFPAAESAIDSSLSTSLLDFHMLYYHTLGDLQENDRLIYFDPLDSKCFLHVAVSSNGDYIFIYIRKNTIAAKNLVYYLKITDFEKFLEERPTDEEAKNEGCFSFYCSIY